MKAFTFLLFTFLSFNSLSAETINSPTVNAMPEKLVAEADIQENTQLLFKTSKGNFSVELFNADAPATTKNFIAYVNSGFYSNTLFHRVIPSFMVQGGGFIDGMVQKSTQAPVKNESLSGRSNERGTLAMARTNDPHSATSQFFINVNDNWNLDAKGSQHGYTVFGEVTSGMDIVDNIVNVPTTRVNHYRDVPKQDILILSIEIVTVEKTAVPKSAMPEIKTAEMSGENE